MAYTHSYLINGSFNHAISPFDRGFAYGDGVFRTLVMRNGAPESWPQHYQKLVADCAAINIVCPSAELLMSDLQQLFLLDEVAVAKIIITRGEGNRGYTPPPITAPMRVVTKSALQANIHAASRASIFNQTRNFKLFLPSFLAAKLAHVQTLASCWLPIPSPRCAHGRQCECR